MSFLESFERILIKFGNNNKPAIIAAGIALAKGIFRPIFTMADKSQDPKSKRYAAIREGLTEAVAIPVYYSGGKLCEKIATIITVPKRFVSREIYQKHLKGDTSKEVVDAMKHAKTLADENLPRVKSTLGFIGVLVSALFTIPAVCSLTIKPIMAAMDKRNKTTGAAEKPLRKPYSPQVVKKPQFNGHQNINGVYSLSAPSCGKVGSVC